MLGSYQHVGIAAHGILKEFNWNTVSLLYHNHGESTGKGNSDCFFSLSSIYRYYPTTSSQETFDEENVKRPNFNEILAKIKKKARSECQIVIYLYFIRNKYIFKKKLQF